MAELCIKHNARPGRSLVDLRVAMAASEAAATALAALQDVTALRTAPDRWLLLSDRQPPAKLQSLVSQVLAGQLHLACDASAGLVCIAVEGRGARRLLAMGCGLDFSAAGFPAPQHRRTRLAGLAVVVHATGPAGFDLYVDRSCGEWLAHWLHCAAGDPLLTRGTAHARSG